MYSIGSRLKPQGEFLQKSSLRKREAEKRCFTEPISNEHRDKDRYNKAFDIEPYWPTK